MKEYSCIWRKLTFYIEPKSKVYMCFFTLRHVLSIWAQLQAVIEHILSSRSIKATFIFIKKVALRLTLLLPIAIFWAAVFIAFLLGRFVEHTIIFTHLGFLHSARRVEYMIIFFIAGSTVRQKKDLCLYLYFIIAVLFFT